MNKWLFSWLAYIALRWISPNWSALLRLREKKYLSVKLPEVTSLQDITECEEQVEWTPDQELAPRTSLRFVNHILKLLWMDCLSYPETVWKRKKDDCDGKAILAAALLRQIGRRGLLLSVIMLPLKKSHAVCVFDDIGRTRYFSNSNLVTMLGLDIDMRSVISAVAKKNHVLAWSLVDPKTFKVLEVHRGL